MQCAGMPTFPVLCQSLSLKNLFRCHVSFGKRQVLVQRKKRCFIAITSFPKCYTWSGHFS